MEEKKNDNQIEEKKKVFFIQPHDARIEVNWKFEFINPEENTNKEK